MAGNVPFYHRDPVRIIAHRGGAGYAPENSLRAIRLSLDRSADVLEVDVRRTRDGVFVLHHDRTLKRVAHMDARPEDLLSVELDQIDLGAFWEPSEDVSPRENGDGSLIVIPKLRDALEAFPSARFSLDVKVSNTMAIRSLYELLESVDAMDRVIVGSLHEDVVLEARRISKRVPTQATSREVGTLFIRALCGLSLPESLPFESVAIPKRWRGIPIALRAFVRALHKRNVHVSVWTINCSSEMNRLLVRGVDGIITDFPHRAAAVLEKRTNR